MMPRRIAAKFYIFLSKEKSPILLVSIILLLLVSPLIEEVMPGSGLIYKILWALVLFSAIFHRTRSKVLTAFVTFLLFLWLGLSFIPNEIDDVSKSLQATLFQTVTMAWVFGQNLNITNNSKC